MKKLWLLLILMMLLIAACSGGAGPEVSAPTEAAPAQEEVAEATEAPAEEAAAQEAAASGAKVLRITFSWPNRIDPAVGNDYVGSTSLANLYDSLIFPNAQGGVDPWLAESWDVSDDDLTYTFHLRQGVKFHDGSEL